MGVLAEIKFYVTDANIKSEFGYCWLTKSEKDSYILDLEGSFEINGKKIPGRACIESNDGFEKIYVDEMAELTQVRKEFNLGSIELRNESPSAVIATTVNHIKHIWDLCQSDQHSVCIGFITVDSVLEVREVASILVEIEKIEYERKRGFFG